MNIADEFTALIISKLSSHIANKEEPWFFLSVVTEVQDNLIILKDGRKARVLNNGVFIPEDVVLIIKTTNGPLCAYAPLRYDRRKIRESLKEVTTWINIYFDMGCILTDEGTPTQEQQDLLALARSEAEALRDALLDTKNIEDVVSGGFYDQQPSFWVKLHPPKLVDQWVEDYQKDNEDNPVIYPEYACQDVSAAREDIDIIENRYYPIGSDNLASLYYSYILFTKLDRVYNLGQNPGQETITLQDFHGNITPDDTHTPWINFIYSIDISVYVESLNKTHSSITDIVFPESNLLKVYITNYTVDTSAASRREWWSITIRGKINFEGFCNYMASVYIKTDPLEAFKTDLTDTGEELTILVNSVTTKDRDNNYETRHILNSGFNSYYDPQDYYYFRSRFYREYIQEPRFGTRVKSITSTDTSVSATLELYIYDYYAENSYYWPATSDMDIFLPAPYEGVTLNGLSTKSNFFIYGLGAYAYGIAFRVPVPDNLKQIAHGSAWKAFINSVTFTVTTTVPIQMPQAQLFYKDNCNGSSSDDYWITNGSGEDTTYDDAMTALGERINCKIINAANSAVGEPEDCVDRYPDWCYSHGYTITNFNSCPYLIARKAAQLSYYTPSDNNGTTYTPAAANDYPYTPQISPLMSTNIEGILGDPPELPDPATESSCHFIHSEQVNNVMVANLEQNKVEISEFASPIERVIDYLMVDTSELDMVRTYTVLLSSISESSYNLITVVFITTALTFNGTQSVTQDLLRKYKHALFILLPGGSISATGDDVTTITADMSLTDEERLDVYKKAIKDILDNWTTLENEKAKEA